MQKKSKNKNQMMKLFQENGIKEEQIALEKFIEAVKLSYVSES